MWNQWHHKATMQPDGTRGSIVGLLYLQLQGLYTLAGSQAALLLMER